MNSETNDNLSSSPAALRQQGTGPVKETVTRQLSEKQNQQSSMDDNDSNEVNGAADAAPTPKGGAGMVPKGSLKPNPKEQGAGKRESAAKGKLERKGESKGKPKDKSKDKNESKGKAGKRDDSKGDDSSKVERVSPRDNPSPIKRQARKMEGVPTHVKTVRPGNLPQGVSQPTNPAPAPEVEAPAQVDDQPPEEQQDEIEAIPEFTADSCKSILAEFAGHAYDDCALGCHCHLEIDQAVKHQIKRGEMQTQLHYLSTNAARISAQLRGCVQESTAMTSNESVQAGLMYVEEPNTPPINNWRKVLGYACALGVAIPLGLWAAKGLVFPPTKLGWAVTLDGLDNAFALPKVDLLQLRVASEVSVLQTMYKAAKVITVGLASAVSTYAYIHLPALWIPGRRSYTAVIDDIAAKAFVHPQLVAHVAAKAITQPDRSMHVMRELTFAAEQWARINQPQWSELERGSQIFRTVRAVGGDSELALSMYDEWSGEFNAKSYRRLRGHASGAGIGSRAKA